MHQTLTPKRLATSRTLMPDRSSASAARADPSSSSADGLGS
jgi:hypothetical protein